MQSSNHVVDRLVAYYLLSRADADGSVGVGSALALGRIGLDISEKPVQGRKACTYSKDDVRNALDRLSECGVLLGLGEKNKRGYYGRFVFEAFEADVGYSVHNKLTRILRESYAVKTELNQDTYDTNLRETYTNLTIKDIPTIYPTNARDSEQPASERFAMHAEWIPSEVFKKQINQTWKPNDQQLTALKAKLFGFVAYWVTKLVFLTQSEWELKLWNNELEKLFTQPLSAPKASVSHIRSGKPAQSPPRALSVPEKLFGKVLQDWGIKHGFRGVNPGEEDDQYRAFLRNQCERFNARQERDAAGVRS